MQHEFRVVVCRRVTGIRRCNPAADALGRIADLILLSFTCIKRYALCLHVDQGRLQLSLLSLYRIHLCPHFICDAGVIAISQWQRIQIPVDVILGSEPAVCSNILIAIRQEAVVARRPHIIVNGCKTDRGCPIIVTAVLLKQILPHAQIVPILIDTRNGDGKIIPGVGDLVDHIDVLCERPRISWVVLIRDAFYNGGFIVDPSALNQPVGDAFRGIITASGRKLPERPQEKIRCRQKDQHCFPIPCAFLFLRQAYNQEGKEEKRQNRIRIRTSGLLAQNDKQRVENTQHQQDAPFLSAEPEKGVPLLHRDINQEENKGPAPPVGHVGHSVQNSAADGKQRNQEAENQQHFQKRLPLLSYEQQKCTEHGRGAHSQAEPVGVAVLDDSGRKLAVIGQWIKQAKRLRHTKS